MSLFNMIAIFITISAIFSFINHKFIKLPSTASLQGRDPYHPGIGHWWFRPCIVSPPFPDP